jgi:hypothetical protein
VLKIHFIHPSFTGLSGKVFSPGQAVKAVQLLNVPTERKNKYGYVSTNQLFLLEKAAIENNNKDTQSKN